MSEVLEKKIEQAKRIQEKQAEIDFRLLTMRMLHGIMYLMFRDIDDEDLVAKEGGRVLLTLAEDYIKKLSEHLR